MIILTKDTFNTEVLESKGLTIVDFWGDNCSSCIALMPEYENISKEFGERVKFTKFNIGESVQIAMGQRVLGLPTVILYKDGVKVEQLIKENANKENITELLNKYL